MAAGSYEVGSKRAGLAALAVGTAALILCALGCAGARSPLGGAADPLPLPEPLGAFGSTLLDGSVYVLGGHLGGPHGFSTASESNAFQRLDLATGSWEDLGVVSPAVEGAGLAAHGRLVYRAGGLRVDNAPGQPALLRSTRTVQSYDPASGSWTDLPPLPVGRSAHGTVVIGDRLYAVAGWALDGDIFSGRFDGGGFVLDLSRSDAGWEPIPPPPFRLRSLSVTAVGDDLYAIGGATDVPGEFSDRVYVLDTRAGTWSTGPKLPGGGPLAGFGAASCSRGGELYVNDADGLYCLSPRRDAWEPVASSMRTKRIFNALLCVGDGELLAVGGFDVARGLASTADVETIVVTSPRR